MKLVSTISGQRGKKKWKAIPSSECLMLVGRHGESVKIPIGSASTYLDGNTFLVDTSEGSLRISVSKFGYYEFRLARDLVNFISGEGGFPPKETHRVERWLMALALLPFGIPAITLGGAIPGAISFLLYYLCYEVVVQNAKISQQARHGICISLGCLSMVFVFLAFGLGANLFEPKVKIQIVDQVFSTPEEYSPPPPVDHELNSDSDDDGVLGVEEYENGTDPQKSDSDGDLISDRDEIDSKYLNPIVNELVFRFDFEELRRSRFDGSVRKPTKLVFRNPADVLDQEVGAKIQQMKSMETSTDGFAIGSQSALDKKIRELPIIDICRGKSDSDQTGFLWAITEEPGDTSLKAFDLNGKLIKEIEIPGVSNDRWRSIASATLNRGGFPQTYLYIGDTRDRIADINSRPKKILVAPIPQSRAGVPAEVSGVYILQSDGVYRHSIPGNKSYLTVKEGSGWNTLFYESEGIEVKGRAVIFEADPKPPTIYRIAEPGGVDAIDPAEVEVIPFEFEKVRGVMGDSTLANCNSLLVDPDSGDVYLIADASWNTRVFRISGLAIDEFSTGKISNLVAKYIGHVSGVKKGDGKGQRDFSKTLAVDTNGKGSEIILMTEHLMFRASRGRRSFEEMLLGSSESFVKEDSLAGGRQVYSRPKFALAMAEDGEEYFCVGKDPGLYRTLKRFSRRSERGVGSAVLGNSGYALSFRGSDSYIKMGNNLGEGLDYHPPVLTNDEGRTVGLWFLPYAESGSERLHPLWIISHDGESRHFEGLFFRNDTSGSSGCFLFAKWGGSSLPNFGDPDVTIVESAIVPTGIVYAVALVCESSRTSLFVGRAIPKGRGSDGTILERQSASDSLRLANSASKWTIGGWASSETVEMPSACGVVDGIFCYDAVLGTSTLTSILRPQHRRGYSSLGKDLNDTDGNGVSEHWEPSGRAASVSAEGSEMTMERFEATTERVRRVFEKWDLSK